MQVYIVQNVVNGKCYVGQTIRDLDAYLRSDVTRALKRTKDRKPYLYAAIRKYGAENFTIRCIHKCADKAEMDRAEKAYIKLFGTRDPELGYNLTDGGDGVIGAIRTDEWKQNISKGNTGKVWDAARRLAHSIRQKGKVLSEEHKEKIGLGVKGTKKPEQWLEKLIARIKNRKGEKRKPRTKEHQLKLSESRIANTLKRRQEAECRLNPMALPAAA